MRKHLHAIRVVERYDQHRLMRELWVVNSESKDLTLDDILRINEIDDEYEFFQGFYAGYLSKEEFNEKYSERMICLWRVKD